MRKSISVFQIPMMNSTLMPTAAPSVTIQQASLMYHAQPLFKELNFTLQGGACTCLLGPSGVGKSSLLHLIAGLTDKFIHDPKTTRIHASDQLPLQNRIAYMAQDDLLLPWLSVLQNVMLGSRLRTFVHDHASQTEQALYLLEQIGLKRVAFDYPATLSGGMRQRVALARTLFERRPIVLMDEPFSALDVITRYRLQALTAELLTGRTVLLVTHDPMEALRLGHRIHVLAGSPARLDSALIPKGNPPRDISCPSLLELHAELLQRLVQAQEEMSIC